MSQKRTVTARRAFAVVLAWSAMGCGQGRSAEKSGGSGATSPSRATMTIGSSAPSATGAGVGGVTGAGSGVSTGSGVDASGGTSTSSGGGTVFYDDFTSASLSSAWVAMDRHGDYQNNIDPEQQCYLPANVALVGGNLVITSKVQTETCGDATHPISSWNYTSGMVQWSTFSFTYGTLEFRAKIAGGQGTWPAIWLLGQKCQASNVSTADNVGTCNWPDVGSDEIDIAEILSSQFQLVNEQIHSGSNNPGCTAGTSDVSQNWHVYQLVWTVGSVVWMIDGVQTCKVTSTVPSTPMFLIINTALGGAGGTVDNSTLPQTMSVDYVKVTQP
jgi:beta-glucanase (GH16 family)